MADNTLGLFFEISADPSKAVQALSNFRSASATELGALNSHFTAMQEGAERARSSLEGSFGNMTRSVEGFGGSTLRTFGLIAAGVLRNMELEKLGGSSCWRTTARQNRSLRQDEGHGLYDRANQCARIEQRRRAPRVHGKESHPKELMRRAAIYPFRDRAIEKQLNHPMTRFVQFNVHVQSADIVPVPAAHPGSAERFGDERRHAARAHLLRQRHLRDTPGRKPVLARNCRSRSREFPPRRHLTSHPELSRRSQFPHPIQRVYCDSFGRGKASDGNADCLGNELAGAYKRAHPRPARADRLGNALEAQPAAAHAALRRRRGGTVGRYLRFGSGPNA